MDQMPIASKTARPKRTSRDALSNPGLPGNSSVMVASLRTQLSGVKGNVESVQHRRAPLRSDPFRVVVAGAVCLLLSQLSPEARRQIFQGERTFVAAANVRERYCGQGQQITASLTSARPPSAAGSSRYSNS